MMTEADVFAPPPAAAQGGPTPGPLGLVECRCVDCAREPGRGDCPNFRVRAVPERLSVAAMLAAYDTPAAWLTPLDALHYCLRFVPRQAVRS